MVPERKQYENFMKDGKTHGDNNVCFAAKR